MKTYDVVNNETGYRETFYDLPAAKKAMRENNAKGFITKIWRNGDWEPMGEIKLAGQNKTFAANTRQTKASYK